MHISTEGSGMPTTRPKTGSPGQEGDDDNLAYTCNDVYGEQIHAFNSCALIMYFKLVLGVFFFFSNTVPMMTFL